jgi:hypothetical protein
MTSVFLTKNFAYFLLWSVVVNEGSTLAYDDNTTYKSGPMVITVPSSVGNYCL